MVTAADGKNGCVPSRFTKAGHLSPDGAPSAVPDNVIFQYGTAGFRTKDECMPFIAFRTAVYASQRARDLGATLGLMITASHNPVGENGVKLIDPSGEMLPPECEHELTALINATDEEFAKKLQEMNSGKGADGANVRIGSDTRPSSAALVDAARCGCQLGGITYVTLEECTTPQLHFIVRAVNDPEFASPDEFVSRFSAALREFNEHQMIPKRDASNYTPEVHLDCSNGVGALWVQKYLDGSSTGIRANLLNTDVRSRNLNYRCGADFVKITCSLPAGFQELPPGTRCASLDGDADRLVYFYVDAEPASFHLLDGDHIGALFARFIKEQLTDCDPSGQLTFGVVQTAYANGNSTRYFEEQLGIKPLCVRTGVKHLHEAAKTFDVAVYFEANGHGTVIFSGKFHQAIRSLASDGSVSARRLHAFSRLVNEVVGDGIADFLAVEMLLRYYGWSIADWERHTYLDAPSCQLKIPVPDRSIYCTEADSETCLTAPDGLQAQLETVVGQFDKARAFARPSGTENIVRVYAEAETDVNAKKLAHRLASLIDLNWIVPDELRD
ncbi:Protein F21D5.1 [Aphelenchoides avenae]|nr:Protein F21D5.1 [Aphelenchus avenae]